MTTLPTADSFAPYIEKAFRPRGWHGTLTLVSIDRRMLPGWDAFPVKPFSLVFAGPRDDILPEGFYEFDAEGGGVFQFHLAPVHTPPARPNQEYQAAFG